MSDTPKTAVRKVTEENFSKLKEKLRELFQLDRGDLDFGLYRIMAHKSAEVGEFLDNKLLPQVSEALGAIAQSDESVLQARLEELENTLKEADVSPDASPKVREIHKQLKAVKDDRQTEADTYNHLYNFFSRYYDEGDFMSLRRYKGAGKEAYSIPYNGEEVKLHWANADQYYIKTTENYCSYIFIPGDDKLRVRFEIAKADNEKDNIKEANGKQRFFVLSKDYIAEEKNQLVVRFEHRPLTEGEKKAHPQNGIRRQGSINKDAGQRILGKLEKAKGDWRRLLSAPCTTEADSERTLLDKHIAVYTAKNSFDYFIHKDLGGFLRRELDTYIKNEVISVDNLELNDDPTVFIRGLAQVKAIRTVGHKIIDFLAQLENFQKQLWLKKKFVLETQYCVTLDKVPVALYPAIVKNRAQHDEWVKLFAIDELDGADGATAYSKALKPEFLKENPYLVLDTKHFDQKFTDKLLVALSDAGPIEEQMNGLLVHGENFQAISLLQEKYRGQVQSVYIDPPYNSPSTRILYKNNYLHSSWMAMIENRLEASKPLQSDCGFLTCAIDENEERYLSLLLEQKFPEQERVCVSVIHNPRGIQGDGFSFTNESAYFVYPKGMKVGRRLLNLRKEKPLMKTGGESARHTAKNCFYPIYVKQGKVIGFGEVAKDSYSPSSVTKELDDGVLEVWPISVSDNQERKWRYARQSIETVKDALSVRIGKNDNPVIYLSKSSESYRTIWSEPEFNAAEYGSTLLKNMNIDGEFTYPKSLWAVHHCLIAGNVKKNSLVLDYFAGSGTTGHAVINLNREDGGQRKFILMEVGEHFDDVLLPRIKKIVYSTKWKDGKPEGRNGISQLFKYIRLESYEDSLDSLAVKSREDLFTGEDKGIVEDYQLRYALGEETTDNASLVGQDFIDPFNYTLSVVRDGVRRDVNVDLAETFNFLLGLRLTSRRQMNGVLAITGATRKGENCLILWRNQGKVDASQLNKWFTKHRKTFGDNLNLIYVNGDHTLNTLRESSDKWEAITTERVFRERMFSNERGH